MIYVTVTPRVQNNRDCTSHTILSVFRQLVGCFNETAMLIEWLEKNTDETVPGTGRVGVKRLELQGFTA